VSEGRVLDALDSTIVRVVTADGLAGYGEEYPLGTRYLPAFAVYTFQSKRQLQRAPGFLLGSLP